MPKIELLDGAMGSEFIKRGYSLPNHIWSANMNIDNSNVVKDIHHEYVKSGSSYLTTNTFRSTARAYLKTGLTLSESHEYSSKSILNAVIAAKNASKNNVKVIGSIAPLEDCYKPELFPGKSVAYDEFKIIGNNLIDAGVDMILLETMNSIKETESCIKALTGTDRTIWVSFILKDEKHILSGESLVDAIKMLNIYDIECLLINCSPLHKTMLCLNIIKDNWHKRWGIYPNLGIGNPSPDGNIKIIHSNDNFIKLIYKAVEMGATLLGGCCGSSPDHIAYLKSKMDKFKFYQ